MAYDTGPSYGGYAGRPPGPDLAAVNPLDWAAVAAGSLAFIFSFVSFYTADVTLNFAGQHIGQSASESAWHGFFGWFGVLLALAAALLIAASVLMPTATLPAQTRLVVFGGFVLALIFLIVAAFVTPGASTSSTLPVRFSVDYGRGFGYWVDLILVAIGAVVSFLASQQFRTRPPAAPVGYPAPRAAVPPPPTYAPPPPAPQAYQPQPGYQAPPGYQYQPPQPPPATYQPPPPPTEKLPTTEPPEQPAG